MNLTAALDRRGDEGPAAGVVEVIAVDAHSSPARVIDDGIVIDGLEERFAAAIGASPVLLALTESLQGKGRRYAVLGGWVRDTVCDILALPLAEPPRDLDIVACGIEIDELQSNLPANVQPTIFGGIQSSAPPVRFDVWPLHETFLIRHLKLQPTFDSLLQSTDFNINAGLFFPRQSGEAASLMDGGMLAALQERELHFNCPFLPFPMIQCARIAAYAGKLSLGLGPATTSGFDLFAPCQFSCRMGRAASSRPRCSK